MLRSIKNFLYAGLLSCTIASGCAIKPPIAKTPLTSFLISNYVANVDFKPGNYELVNIYPYKHCYYSKRFNNGDELIIKDYDCDTFGDRVSVLRGNELLISEDFSDLEEITQGILNLMIRISIDEKGVEVLPNEVNFHD